MTSGRWGSCRVLMSLAAQALKICLESSVGVNSAIARPLGIRSLLPRRLYRDHSGSALFVELVSDSGHTADFAKPQFDHDDVLGKTG